MDDFAGIFQKKELISVLCVLCVIFDNDNPSTEKFLAEIKKTRASIYKPRKVLHNVVGPLHGD